MVSGAQPRGCAPPRGGGASVRGLSGLWGRRLQAIADANAMRVCVVERLSHVGRDTNGIIDWKLMITVQAIPETLPLHLGHHVEQEAIGFP